MALVYYELIKKGLRKVEDVPLKWRADVQAMIDSDSANNIDGE